MANVNLEQPIHFAGTPLGPTRHICAFFDGPDDEYRFTLPFLKEGIDRQEQAYYVVDPASLADVRRRTEAAGIALGQLEELGQYTVRGWDQHYVKDGRFDGAAALALIEGFLKERQHRYALCRVIGHGEWAAKDSATTDALIEYETRLNLVLPKYPDPVICAYDTTRWGGGAILDMLRTHPMVLIRGVLHANPFFVPPEEFLRELRERSARAHA
jgi:hypothetical protein